MFLLLYQGFCNDNIDAFVDLPSSSICFGEESGVVVQLRMIQECPRRLPRRSVNFSNSRPSVD